MGNHNCGGGFDWTDEIVAQCRIWARDESSGKIAGRLGVSRNAVIGKFRRQKIKLGAGRKGETMQMGPPLKGEPKPTTEFYLGQRVKLSEYAVECGILPKKRERLGRFVRETTCQCVIIDWDGARSYDRLHRNFITKAENIAPEVDFESTPPKADSSPKPSRHCKVDWDRPTPVAEPKVVPTTPKPTRAPYVARPEIKVAPPPATAKPPTPAQTVVNAKAADRRQQRARAAGECPEPMAPAPNAAALHKRLGAGDAMVDLAHNHCRWPINDPLDDDFHYCAAQIDPAQRPLCAHHAWRAVHG